MSGIQTSLGGNNVDLKELKEINRESLRYVLEKYKVWKRLKELEKCNTKI